MVEEKRVNYYTNLIYFIVLACLVVIRVCSNYGLFSFMGNYASYILSLVTQVGIILLLPLFLMKLFTKAKPKELLNFCCFKKISVRAIFLSVILGFVVFFLNVYVSNFFNSIIALFGYKHATGGSSMPATWWGLLLSLICTAVLPAVCEETLHRGMLMNGNSMLGIKKSILISGFLFGLLHLNIEQFFYATIIGLFLAYLCWGCSSVVPCIIVHFMNNATSVFLSFARAKGWVVGNIFSAISKFLLSNPVLGFVMFFLVLCLLVLIAIELTKWLMRDSFAYNFVKRQKYLKDIMIRESYFQQIEAIRRPKMLESEDYVPVETPMIIDEQAFLEFVNKNIHSIILKEEQQENKNKFTMDIKSKIFLFGAVALSAIVTLMTFIWGLL